MTIIRTVCAHDCPDQCSLIATVENGRIVRVQQFTDTAVIQGALTATPVTGVASPRSGDPGNARAASHGPPTPLTSR